MKRKHVGGYIIINTGVISDNTLPSVVPGSGRVNLVEINFQILNYSYKVVCFLLGDSPASEFYVPTFRNTVPSS